MSWNAPKEISITKSIIKWLNEKYCTEGYAWKVGGDGWAKSGMPDVSFVLRGQAYFFEVKRPPKIEPTDLQRAKMAKLEEAGAKCFTVNSKAQVIEIMEREV